MSDPVNPRRFRSKSIAWFVGVESAVVLAVLLAGVIGTHPGQEIPWGVLIVAMVIGFVATAPLAAAMVLARGQRLVQAIAGVMAGAVGFIWALIVGVTSQTDWSVH